MCHCGCFCVFELVRCLLLCPPHLFPLEAVSVTSLSEIKGRDCYMPAKNDTKSHPMRLSETYATVR